MQGAVALELTSLSKAAFLALNASGGIIHCCPVSPFATVASRPFATILETPVNKVQVLYAVNCIEHDHDATGFLSHIHSIL